MQFHHLFLRSCMVITTCEALGRRDYLDDDLFELAPDSAINSDPEIFSDMSPLDQSLVTDPNVLFDDNIEPAQLTAANLLAGDLSCDSGMANIFPLPSRRRRQTSCPNEMRHENVDFSFLIRLHATTGNFPSDTGVCPPEIFKLSIVPVCINDETRYVPTMSLSSTLFGVMPRTSLADLFHITDLTAIAD